MLDQGATIGSQLVQEENVMANVVSWYDKKIEKLRQLPKYQLLLFIAVKFLAGVAIGLLLAIWLPVWTWWIFLVVAVVIAIPLYIKIFSK